MRLAFSAAILLVGCTATPTSLISSTELSVTYCYDGKAAPHPDELAAAYCRARGLLAKEVPNEGQCQIGSGWNAPSNLYSYECVADPRTK